MHQVIYIKSSMCSHGNIVSCLPTFLENGWRVLSITSDQQGSFLVVIERNYRSTDYAT